MKVPKYEALAMAFLLVWGEVAGQVASEGVSSPTLTLAATDFEGLPLAGASFEVSFGEGDEGPLVVTTDDSGQATVGLASESVVAEVRPKEEGLVSLPGGWRSTEGARSQVFQFFARPAGEDSMGEAEAFVRAWPRLLEDRASRGEVAADRPLAPEHLSAFLHGMRREAAEPALLDSDTGEERAALSVRLVDALGAPVGNVRVDLFSYDAAARQVRLVAFERTNGEGLAVFDYVEDGGLYRAEADVEGDLVARSPIVRGELGSPTIVPPMVLRPERETISGLLYDHDNPAANVLMKLERTGGRPPLTVITDEFGYFSFGPVTTDWAMIQFTRSSETGPVEFLYAVEAGGREVILPLEALMMSVGGQAGF